MGWHDDRTMTQELVLKALQQYGMNCSMSRKGNCYDIACIESFHGVLKKELVYQQQYATRAQVQQDIWEYIENFYNCKKIHLANGYLSPAKKEHIYEFEAA